MSASPDCLTGHQTAAEAGANTSNFSSNSSGSSNCSSSSIGSVGSGAAMASSLETSGAALFAQQLPPETQQQQLQQYFYTGPCEYPTMQFGDQNLQQQQQLQFPPPQQQQQQHQQQQPAKPQKPKRKRVASQAQRKAANVSTRLPNPVRERRRMFNLNEAFDTLRTKVPTFAFEKRLSRIETLRLAITYIRFMGQVINGVPPDQVRIRQQQQQQPMQFQELHHPASLTLQQPQLQQYPWHSAAVPSTSSTVWDPSLQSPAEIQ